MKVARSGQRDAAKPLTSALAGSIVRETGTTCTQVFVFNSPWDPPGVSELFLNLGAVGLEDGRALVDMLVELGPDGRDAAVMKIGAPCQLRPR